MTTLKLYTSEVCPYAQRTRIVLGEKAIEHQVVEIDIDNKPDWFVELTPMKRVPVIDHDGFILWESATLNEYLDASFSGPPLRPADEQGRAVMRNEIRYIDSVFLPQLYKMLFEQNSTAQEALKETVRQSLLFLEDRLQSLQSADGPYWLGREFGLADIAIYPFFERLPVFDHYRGIKMPSACKRLQRWLDQVAERSAVAVTAHDLDWFIPRYIAYASGVGQGLSAQAFRSGAAN
jgi:glutathione S-transferase